MVIRPQQDGNPRDDSICRRGGWGRVFESPTFFGERGLATSWGRSQTPDLSHPVADIKASDVNDSDSEVIQI